MQDPLKQGLKLEETELLFRGSKLIRMQDPLKQGLKLLCFSAFRFAKVIRMQDPLKQGLKP